MTVTAADRRKVVAYARAQVGHAYKWLGTGPSFDCSGLVLKSWEQAGVVLPHQSGEQARALGAVAANLRSKRQLLPGDVVFYYGSTDDYASISHCAIYVGKVEHNASDVVAAIDDAHGVLEHMMNWALYPSGFGYVGH